MTRLSFKCKSLGVCRDSGTGQLTCMLCNHYVVVVVRMSVTHVYVLVGLWVRHEVLVINGVYNALEHRSLPPILSRTWPRYRNLPQQFGAVTRYALYCHNPLLQCPITFIWEYVVIPVYEQIALFDY